MTRDGSGEGPGERRDDGPGGPPGDPRWDLYGEWSGPGLDTPSPVPDDARELEPDRLAMLRERRRATWLHRGRRLLLTRRWERFGLSGPIVFLCLLATAGVGALAVVFVPHPPTPPPAAGPLASAPALTVPPPGTTPQVPPPDVEPADGGLVGRLLPATSLDPDVGDLDPSRRRLVATDLRPALVLLTGQTCGCAGGVRELYRQGREFRLAVWLVAAPREPGAAGDVAVRAALNRLDVTGAGGGARWAVDPLGALDRAVSSSGLTAVLVRSDGRVAAVDRRLPVDGKDVPALEIQLAGLVPDSRH